ncbi:hypothetical protein BO443_220031 [Burkholderia orbicola]
MSPLAPIARTSLFSGNNARSSSSLWFLEIQRCLGTFTKNTRYSQKFKLKQIVFVLVQR